MGKKFIGYANLGLLGDEKHVVWTAGRPNPEATESHKAEIELPDGWDWYKNDVGTYIFVAPDDQKHFAYDALGGHVHPRLTVHEVISQQLTWKYVD